MPHVQYRAQIFYVSDLLIILSDIDGFYNGNPKECSDYVLINTVTEITDKERDFAGGQGTAMGTGGMVTKLNAADMVTKSGIHMVLANGVDPLIILDILEGKNIGTLFVGKEKISRNTDK
jgi:glutamate 5-kinase